MTMTNRVIDLDSLVLDDGAHQSFEEGACLLEAVSYIAGETFSDHPKCVSPVLAAYGRRINDALAAENRQKLKQYLPGLIGTRTDDPQLEDRRAAVAGDWAIRVATPRWLDLAGRSDLAEELRTLPEFVTRAAIRAFAPRMREISHEMWAARLAARDSLGERVRAELAKRGIPAAADAVADADADADAVAVAVAAADADADAKYSDRWWAVYNAVRAELRKRLAAADIESAWAQVARLNQAEGIELLGRMIAAEVAQ